MYNTDLLRSSIKRVRYYSQKQSYFYFAGLAWIETCIDYARRLLKIKYEKPEGQYPMSDIRVIVLDLRLQETTLLKEFDEELAPIESDSVGENGHKQPIKELRPRNWPKDMEDDPRMIPPGFNDIVDKRAHLIDVCAERCWRDLSFERRQILEFSAKDGE
ncbi:MAG: hypothetical protein LBT62_01100 [Deltaproteobacteria bacterium]|jgi:hypothetical protein|nr:hypothetical protein [Deltaproteobacteria bacterium]